MQPEALNVPDSSPTGLVHNPALVQSHITIPAQGVCKRQASIFHHLCSETLKTRQNACRQKNCCCNTPVLCSAWNPFDKWMCFLHAPSFFSYTISNALLITTLLIVCFFLLFCARTGANLLNLANPIWMNTICICKLAVGSLGYKSFLYGSLDFFIACYITKSWSAVLRWECEPLLWILFHIWNV